MVLFPALDYNRIVQIKQGFLYWSTSVGWGRFGAKRAQRIQQTVDLIILSVSGLFALLVLILIGFLLIYCQRVQNETNIEAANQTSVSNILLQNSKGTVYI